MTVEKLLEGLKYKLIRGSVDTGITGVCYDSRRIRYGDAYICIKGGNFDGHTAIYDVVTAGARLIVIQAGMEESIPPDLPEVVIVSFESTRSALAEISAAWFSHPARELRLIGITGTKGKTTTTYMIKSVLEAAGLSVGLIGTIEIVIGDVHIPSVNTTPESYVIQETFRRMVDAGLQVCVMEVSSQALMLDRVAGFDFDIGVFTNLSLDHIGEGEHKDFDDYKFWKSRLFTKCRLGILNGDDKYTSEMLSLSGIKAKLTYGLKGRADYMAKNIFYERMGHALGVRYHLSGKLECDIELPLPGEFSVYNSLCAIAICEEFSIDAEIIKDALKHTAVKGRVEMVPISNDYTCMIDYAHNAVSLESLLTSLRIYNVSRMDKWTKWTFACPLAGSVFMMRRKDRFYPCFRQLQECAKQQVDKVDMDFCPLAMSTLSTWRTHYG